MLTNYFHTCTQWNNEIFFSPLFEVSSECSNTKIRGKKMCKAYLRFFPENPAGPHVVCQMDMLGLCFMNHAVLINPHETLNTCAMLGSLCWSFMWNCSGIAVYMHWVWSAKSSSGATVIAHGNSVNVVNVKNTEETTNMSIVTIDIQ